MNQIAVQSVCETQTGGERDPAEREPDGLGDDLAARLRPFLESQGIPADASIDRLRGGSNNRVYRVSHGGRRLVLKAYYHDAEDPRDRFATERAFYDLLWTAGVRRTAEPLAWDESGRLGLLTLLEGQSVTPEAVTREHVDQLLDFVAQLNAIRRHPLAARISTASESCFSLAGHMDCVDRRVQRVEDAAAQAGVDPSFATFVGTELRPVWERTRFQISRMAVDARCDLRSELLDDQRCLSPSDLGLHNALLDPGGILKFFDFEYAGWDDPAKLACDVFCQPQIPIPPEFREEFVERLEDIFGDATIERRATLLWPLFQVKWCCIRLNEFVESDSARREFAEHDDHLDSRRVIQLTRAREALARLGRIDASRTSH